jgi:hypothetical protein
MLTLVWDVDDVLNNLMAAWFTHEWAPTHPACDLTYSDLRENPPHRVLGIPKVEYLASLDLFRLSTKAEGMEPNPAVLDWLRCHGARYRHLALTARPLESVPSLAGWLFRHFGAYMRTFGFVPSRVDPAMPVYDQRKSEFLEWLGKADVFIDDSVENINAAHRLGVKTVLYPQPWNGNSCTVSEALHLLTTLAVTN